MRPRPEPALLPQGVESCLDLRRQEFLGVPWFDPEGASRGNKFVVQICQQVNRGRVFPSVAVRFLDPATEFVLTRLTDPLFTAYLPLPKNRAMAPRAMLYASDFPGKWDAFRMGRA